MKKLARVSLTIALEGPTDSGLPLQTEVDVEINVLADDGGVLAACMIAAGVAVSSANIEMFDTVLACCLMIGKDGTLLLDPTASQIQSHCEKGTFGATLTVAIVPSLGQVH